MKISDNMIVDDMIDINAQKDYLKIRITILNDGSYEDLRYIDGNKMLFDTNKKNILKVFPVFLNEKIQNQFPRYVRMTIKYNSIKDNEGNE